MTKKVASVVVILVGAALIVAGIAIAVPGDNLTTWSILDGTDGYSSIREYVGRDAYNYIIGASLVAGHISGTLTMKAVFIAAGAITACIGLLSLASSPAKADVEKPSGKHSSDEDPKQPRISGSAVAPTSDNARSDGSAQGDGEHPTSAVPTPLA